MPRRAALYALVGPESEGIDNWSGANGASWPRSAPRHGLPDADLVISGPGESPAPTTASSSSPSPTWPKSGQDGFHPDYNSSPNDNGIVQGIEGSDTSLGWLGFAYYEAEKDR